MASPTEITVAQLSRLVGTPEAPAIVDVSTDEDHAADPRLIPGALRRRHVDVAAWADLYAGRRVVVACQKGLKLSHGVAAWLRHLGVAAETLEGGLFAWRDGGQMLVPAARLPPRAPDGRMVWVTRERPKIDRIACPWLIRRFVDPAAVFLFVRASEVEAVAERFAATPFDVDGVFWSHRGERCTFDTMLAEFALELGAARAAGRHRARRRHGPARSRAAGGGTAGGLAGAVAHGAGRPGAARCRDGHLRRALSLGARRHGRDAQLAVPGRRGAPGAGMTGGAMPAGAAPAVGPAPSLARAAPVWGRIGLLSFGGPAAQIALMQDEIVTRRGWVPASSFDRGLAFAMMLPGPEAQQLATWLGWRLHGVAGGLVAGTAFVLPGALLMIALAWVAAAHGEVPLVAAVFAGVQPFVIALVIAAVEKIGRRALSGPLAWGLAVAAFVALFVFGVPFPAVVAGAALGGLALPAPAGAPATGASAGGRLWRQVGLALGALAVLCGGVYLVNRAVFGAVPGDAVAWLFTSAAFVTFGGAYAVLPFVADHAVGLGWLTPAEMLNGLAIAEATPGPLILVTTYAGFFAGWSAGGGWLDGAHAAALATLYTFAPSTALMLAFAPGVERLHAIPLARRMLAGVSAAVVGVIANLAVFLAVAAFVPEGWVSADWTKLGLFAVALVLVFRFRVGMLSLVGSGIAAGVALHAAGLL